MELFGIGLHKVSLGTLVLALGLLGGRRHHRRRDDGGEAGAGLDRGRAARFAYTSTAFPMLTGTLVTVAGFLPIALAEVQHGRVHALDLPGVGHRADRLVVRRRGADPAPGLPDAAGAQANGVSAGAALARVTGTPARHLRHGASTGGYAAGWRWCVRAALHRCCGVTRACSSVSLVAASGSCRSSSFPSSDRPELLVDLRPARRRVVRRHAARGRERLEGGCRTAPRSSAR